MTTAPDTKDFDILDAIIDHRSYPEDEQRVYFDARAAFDLSRALANIDTLEAFKTDLPETAEGEDPDPRVAEVEANLKAAYEKASELRDKLAESQLNLHLRAVDQDTYFDYAVKMRKKYGDKLNDGDPKTQRAANAYFDLLRWEGHIYRVTTPAGVEVEKPGIAFVRRVYNSLPDGERARINTAIDNLYEGENRGFDAAVQSVDFS